LKTKHNSSFKGSYSGCKNASLSRLLRNWVKSWLVFLTRMYENVVVIFATRRTDIKVIFVARQRHWIHIFLLQESGIFVNLLRDIVEPWLFLLRDVAVCGIFFLISRLYCSIHFDLMAAVGQKTKPAVECKRNILFYVSYVYIRTKVFFSRTDTEIFLQIFHFIRDMRVAVEIYESDSSLVRYALVHSVSEFPGF
jgi:hypothetical protein